MTLFQEGNSIFLSTHAYS